MARDPDHSNRSKAPAEPGDTHHAGSGIKGQLQRPLKPGERFLLFSWAFSLPLAKHQAFWVAVKTAGGKNKDVLVNLQTPPLTPQPFALAKRNLLTSKNPASHLSCPLISQAPIRNCRGIKNNQDFIDLKIHITIENIVLVFLSEQQ